ncbi:Uncharacterized protein OS=Singulisphaera acidiphila (strain ATCC BAA-1392 / DSM 18658 / VKM B-2454 / MOB10) GN=Sinac_0826 PE=4 SV=1 [Gemmata massiliana]|uniref:Lipoprotein n=1 Tax=Gemmata massiliana TaxID=1210884 RepID=A0A6P2D105_9BACT|nr:hypothetical protein [Gemmata massiliana]VTR94517.1 Uncharacterized protein OS=Singulisphaera acidiphila (strain ATCC BAA-1392 / DSM 18658 / VKM B-2454 / MOB10) GN=Sinac_0826 PE=4 SV=1 [Gemmata massiliana]
MGRFALFLFGTLALAGCSSNQSQSTSQGPGADAVLHEVGGLIQMYSGETGKGPKKVADLTKYQNGYPLGFQAVQSGDVVVVWGAKIGGEGEAASGPTNVIAYEKKTPTEGGWVLLQNTTTKQMSASDFASAPKAQ